MAGLLHGKVSLITNATSKLGRVLARSVGSSGSKVFLTDSKEDELQNAVLEFQKIGIDAVGSIADLSQPNQHRELFKEVSFIV
jgi:NAD(P)-dependent dehydrogenase (short-subunit alcohol dehydrogenase family)